VNLQYEDSIKIVEQIFNILLILAVVVTNEDFDNDIIYGHSDTI